MSAIKHAPASAYYKNFLVLMVLLILTLVAARIHLPSIGPLNLNFVVAFVIAAVKAFLVVTVFMGVGSATRLTKLWAVIGFIWLLFLFGILLDYAARGWIPVQGWQ
jgi:caa(3)-type oxidase subunit IV